jgi:hypothetical protein
MREFGITALDNKLRDAGFRDVFFLTENLPTVGVLFDHDVSQALIERKEHFVMDRCAQTQLTEEWLAARECAERQQERADTRAAQVRMASESRWLGLGRGSLGWGRSLGCRNESYLL